MLNGFTKLAFILASLLLTACSNDKQAIQAQNSQISEHLQEEGSQTMDSVFSLGIIVAADLSIELLINDIPSDSKEAGSQSAMSLPIHSDVLPGKNVVEILIGTAEVSPNAPLESILTAPPAEKRLILRLQEDIVSEPEPGTFAVEVKNLKEVIWEPEIEEDKIKLPQKLTLEFEAPKSLPAPAWSLGTVRQVEDIQDELIKIHRDITKALQSGELEAVANMSELSYRDEARAYPIGGTVEKRKAQELDTYQYTFSFSDATVPDMLEPLECRAYAGGRLFECFSPDGKPPIRVLSEIDENSDFRFLFSEIDGKLQVVR